MADLSDGKNGPPSSDDAADPFQSLVREHRHIEVTEDHIQSVLSARRGRELLLGSALFSDPAWDILLELYAAALGDRDVGETDLAQSIGAPASVIHRWVTMLIEAELVSISEQGMVSLSSAGSAKMSSLGTRWASAFLAI